MAPLLHRVAIIRPLYVAYRMASTAMTLSDLESHFCCLKPFDLASRENITGQLSVTCEDMNQTTHVACNLNCLIKVTGSHAQSKSGRPIISETVQDRDVNH